MKPKPIAGTSAPAYPTRREFLEKGTLFLIAAGCGGCGGKLEAHPIVAPVFEHGEGRAYMGCVALTSPVFLSEEEALQIIKEELAKEGISLGAGMTLAGVSVEFKDESSTNHWLGEVKPSKVVPGTLDAVDRVRRVGIQYVSEEDNDKIDFANYNTPAIAKRFAEEFQSQAKEDLYIGIMYDPITTNEHAISSPPKNETEAIIKSDLSEKEKEEKFDALFEECWNKGKRDALAKSKDLLRRQARDFVAWLRQQKTK